MLPIVSITLFLPLVGALLVIALRKAPPKVAHAISIVASGMTLVGAMMIWIRGSNETGFAQLEQVDWMPAIGAAYRVGVDGVSLPLVMLSTLLFFVTFIYSAKVRERPHAYVVLMLLFETAAIGVFTALDAILFYVFFEVSLVSMYFMIAGWGHEERQRAALMFFLYTLLGSLPLLLAILGMYLGSDSHTFDMRVWIDDPPLTGTAAMLAP